MTTQRFTPSRRGFLGLGAAGLSAPLLASCAGNLDDGDGGGELGQVDFNAPDEYKDREMNVVIWSAMSGVNGEKLDELIKGFNDSQTDIYAEVQYQGGYEESGPKITAGLQAGAVPDIAQFADTWWSRFLLSDVLEPLDDYFDDEYNADQYVGQIFDEGKAGGSTYWISFARSTPLFYYNKDRFAEVGLPDRGPETWDELREWAVELNKLQVDGQPLPVHAFNASDDWPLMAMIWQFGGRISDGLEIMIDGDEAIEAAAWAQSFIYDDGFGYLSTAPHTDFGAGVTATAIGSTGSLNGIYQDATFEVGAAFLPEQVTHGVPTGGNGFSLFKGVPKERKEAAFEVLKYLGTPESSAAWTLGTGYLPIVTAARDVPELAEVLDSDPNFNAAAEQLEIAEPTDQVRQMVTDSTATIISGTQEILSDGGVDPRATFERVAADLRSGVESIQEQYDQWFG